LATSVEMAIAMADAMGLPRESFRLHLRHLSEAGEITFKGHGRSAAAMTTADAGKLLIAVAGSSFVKDSVDTLRGFASLTSRASLASDARRFDVAVIDSLDRVVAYLKNPGTATSGKADLEDYGIAVKMLSIVGGKVDSPKVAVVRRFHHERGRGGALTFVTPALHPMISSEADLADRLMSGRLIQTRHVTVRSMLEIGRSLV
jgi:hypothetical protein